MGENGIHTLSQKKEDFCNIYEMHKYKNISKYEYEKHQ
jgi:hypothetical protein